MYNIFIQKARLYSHVCGAIMLIAGTTIGGGILALPIVTSPCGFAPSIFQILITWLAMTFTSFLLLECNLASKSNTNLISMSRQHCGKWGELIAWVSYLLLLYSLLATYISGASSILGHTLFYFTKSSPSMFLISSILIASVICMVSYGIKLIDHVNRLFATVGIICYILILYLMNSHIASDHLSRTTMTNLASPFPVLVTSFGFHIILPSLVRYLNRDVSLIRFSLLIGSIIPLILYIGWQIAVMGSLPAEGANSMESILTSPDQIGSLISTIAIVTKSKIIASAIHMFCMMTILTSLLGVALSLWDFLVDGFSSIKWLQGKTQLSVATFTPPVLLLIVCPNLFTSLLGYAGIFVSILLGLLPIVMCWQGRKVANWNFNYKAPGGKSALVSFALFFAAVIIIQCATSNTP